MRKFSILLIVVVFISCTQTTTSNAITEQDVKDTILGMFESFSVESNDKANFYDYVTDDYVLYEIGKEMNAAEFLEFASTFNTIEDDWKVSDWNINIDKESAHAFFKNSGRFITVNDGKKMLLNYQWLESAYLVRLNGELKIRFYFSDAISQTSEEID
ncbi:hypothetical protein [Winogradskyella aurantiaca]|uniref:hypothetical protein n=1 Tax=Winogradskyella aurantiaca TaxID=2219558 RepID=UPI000E1E1243|nr:hypothetical protein [Winogradskyella aurantiaca]